GLNGIAAPQRPGSTTHIADRAAAPTATIGARPTQPKGQVARRRRASKSKRAGKSGAKPRAPRGSLLPEAEYELPMLRYLVREGGRAPASEVVNAVGVDLGDRFTPV